MTIVTWSQASSQHVYCTLTKAQSLYVCVRISQVLDNRLTSATVGSASEAYTYDGNDVRVGSTTDSVTTPYLNQTNLTAMRLVEPGMLGRSVSLKTSILEISRT